MSASLLTTDVSQTDSNVSLEEVNNFILSHLTEIPAISKIGADVFPTILLMKKRSSLVADKRVGEIITAEDLGQTFISASLGYSGDALFHPDDTVLVLCSPFPLALNRIGLSNETEMEHQRLITAMIEFNARGLWTWPKGCTLIVDNITYPYGNRRFECRVLLAK